MKTRSDQEMVQPSHVPPPLPQQKIREPLQVENESFWSAILRELRGNQGKGYVISFFLHLVLLAILAVPVIQEMRKPESFTTLLASGVGEDVGFDTMGGFPEIGAPTTSGTDEFLTELLDPLAMDQNFIPNLNVERMTNIAGGTGGTGSGQEQGSGSGGGGLRIAIPENAIRIGNFSVWYWPILGSTLVTKDLKHGEPGEAPKVGQDYHIVIRINVPGNKEFVRLDEYTGEVVGTDGYYQKIPDDAYFYRVSGELVKARPSHRIPVIDGTVEILIRVPAAQFANVQDKIRVHSRTLDEEQKIELVFQARK